MRFETFSDFQYLPFLTRIFKAFKCPKAIHLTQILIETYNNAVIHAHQKRKEKWIGIDLLVSRKRARIRVIDQGPGFKLPKKYFLKPWQTTGRGLALVQARVDKVFNRRQGKHHIFEATVFYA